MFEAGSDEAVASYTAETMQVPLNLIATLAHELAHDLLPKPEGLEALQMLPKSWGLGPFSDASIACRAMVRYYNELRPHSGIEKKCPIMLVKSEGENSPPN